MVELFDPEEELFYFDALRGARGAYYAPYIPSGLLKSAAQELAAVGAAVQGPNGASPPRATPSASDGIPRHRMPDFALPSAAAGLGEEGDAFDMRLVALIDSGIVAAHPLLRTRIAAMRDFTGEGIEDRRGHGTMRALLTLMHHPTARLLIAKVVGARAGSAAGLIAALDWTVAQGAGVLYLALGEYHRLCFGRCGICRAAERVIKARRVVVAAPGNRAGRVACPARARGVTPTVVTPWFTHRPMADLLQRQVQMLRVPDYFG